MTKKRLLLIASLPLTIAMIVGIIALLPDRPGVTKANFDRIEAGMTMAQVEAILGGKGEYETNEWTGMMMMQWHANDGSSAVIYLDSEIDSVGYGNEWYDTTETLLERILRWLQLRSATKIKRNEHKPI